MPENDFDRELLATTKIKVSSLEELSQKEKTITNTKMILLAQKGISGSFDYTHLKSIHKFLFDDIYQWAGLDRYEANITAKFGKGKTLFTPYDKLPTVANTLFNALKDENFFLGQCKEQFVESSASFMNGLNILHPFREGNGRVQRSFMQLLAKKTGYELDFSNVTQEEMVLASINGAQGNLSNMLQILRKSMK